MRKSHIMKYANRLRLARAEKRITQLDTAAAVGMNQSRYWMIENGYRDATPDERAALARVLGSTVDALFPDATPRSEAVAS
jgi:transcriptional regulator with XRE-family HTH domain